MPKKKPRPLDPALEDLGLRVKMARRMRGMTQKALAAEADLDEGQVSRLEKGEIAQGIEAAMLIRLSRALGQPAGWVIAREGQPVPVAPLPGGGDRRRRGARDSKSDRK